MSFFGVLSLVLANLRYGGLENEEESAMTVFVAVSQFSPDRITYVAGLSGGSAIRSTRREAAADAY
jgi:hypothetical protein